MFNVHHSPFRVPSSPFLVLLISVKQIKGRKIFAKYFFTQIMCTCTVQSNRNAFPLIVNDIRDCSLIMKGEVVPFIF
jgi:hypothetical protein